MSEKHWGDPSLSKYKGRVVFQGNNVTDQTATMAAFSDIGGSACLLSASKMADVIAVVPGNSGQQADAPQAYTQAELLGKDTWIELPRDRWPASWFTSTGKPKYRRPVCRLRLALYGHPLSGVFWERYCNGKLKKQGFERVPGWEQCFYHKQLNLFLAVYVDDFKMVGPTKNLPKGWELIQKEIRLDQPVGLQRYLGCDHIVGSVTADEVKEHLDSSQKGEVSECWNAGGEETV